jgi:hypothetical protein
VSFDHDLIDCRNFLRLAERNELRYNSLRYDCRESGLYIRSPTGTPSTLPDLPEHTENRAGMAQRFLPRATEEALEQNKKNDRSVARESSTESLTYGASDLRFCSPTPARNRQQEK